MKISLVIRCYNEEKYIERLLDGILQQNISDLDIVVVDSGSTDNTCSIVSRYPVRLIHIKPEEFSFGYSLNVGCQAAQGEIIVIASAHVYPKYVDWIEKMVKPFSDPNVALVYGKQRGDETTKFSEQQVMKKWFPDRSILNQENPFCNNANAAIRSTVWNQIKYNELLTGCEDTDWARRAMVLGYAICYVADAEIVHLHNESPRQTLNRYKREAIALKHIFPQEQFGFGEFVKLFIANVVSDSLESRRHGRMIRNFPTICSFRWMQFWGAYRGFGQQGPVTTDLKRTFYYPDQEGNVTGSDSIKDPTELLVDYAKSPIEE